MGRPRRVPDADRLHQLPGAPPPEGSATTRRAKATLREHERIAARLAERLDPDELAELLKPNRELVEAVRNVALGIDTTNGREKIAAARLLFEYSLPRPSVEVHARVGVIVVENPYTQSDVEVPVLASTVMQPPLIDAATMAPEPAAEPEP